MFKIIIFFLLVLLASYGFVWLSENSGLVMLNWIGYEIQADTTFLAIAILASFLLIWFSAQIIGYVIGFPTLFMRFFRRRKANNNLKNIESSIAAIFSGDLNKAEKSLSKIEAYGENSETIDSIKTIMSAKLSEEQGNLLSAEKGYNALIDNQETKYFATKGLLNTAFIEGNIDKSIKLAEQAYKLRSDVKNGARSLLELYKKAERWSDAEEFLHSYKKKHTFYEDKNNEIDLKTELSFIWYKQAQSFYKDRKESSVKLDMAYNYAEKAVKDSDHNKEITLFFIDVATEAGKKDKIKKAVEKFWKTNMNFEIAEKYLSSIEASSAKDKFKKQTKIIDRLESINPDSKSILDEIRSKILSYEIGESKNV